MGVHCYPRSVLLGEDGICGNINVCRGKAAYVIPYFAAVESLLASSLALHPHGPLCDLSNISFLVTHTCIVDAG